MVLVTRKTLPVHNLDEIIAYAKANKGKTTMGSAGIGSISHLTLLLFNHLTGADVVHVPYRGLSEATNDLLGGQIDLLFDQVVTATPHILNGSENAIVVTDPAARAIDSERAVGERGRTCRSCKPWPGPRCSCRNERRPRSCEGQRRRAKSDAGSELSPSGSPKSAPTFRRPSSARRRRSANWSMPKSTSGCR